MNKMTGLFSLALISALVAGSVAQADDAAAPAAATGTTPKAAAGKDGCNGKNGCDGSHKTKAAAKKKKAAKPAADAAAPAAGGASQ
jgi:hypothetical protein